jgi:hypothetical protein
MTIRRLPGVPVLHRCRARGLPGPGVPRVRAERPLASRPARSRLRSGRVPGPGVPQVLAELPGHLGTAWLSGRVRVCAAVGAGNVRHMTGRRAVRPAHGRLALNERSLARRARSLSGPERPRSLLPGGELALPVSRLAGRPRLSLPVGILPWPRCLPGTRPASTVLARPRLRRVLSGRALTLAGRHGSRLARYAGGRPLLGGLVSRWLPVRPGSRRPPGHWLLVRLSRPALCLPGEALSLIPLCLPLARVPLPRIPGLPWITRPLGPWARVTGLPRRIRAWPWCVHVRSGALRVGEPRRARAARGRWAWLARARLARRTLPRAGSRRARPGTANARHRVVGTLPGPVGRPRVVHCLPARTRRVTGPGRRAPLRPGARRPWRYVRGAGPFMLPAARVAPVAGINGVSVSFQVGVPLVSVPLRVGSVAGPAVRASVRPAALTIHPAPPGHSVRRSPPQIECRAVTPPGQGRRVIGPWFDTLLFWRAASLFRWRRAAHGCRMRAGDATLGL